MTTGTTYPRDALEDVIEMLERMICGSIAVPVGFYKRDLCIVHDFLESRLDDEDVVTPTQIYLTEK